MSLVYEHLDRIQVQDDPDAIKCTLQELVRPLGINGFVYLVLRPPNEGPTQTDLFTYPREWLDRYRGKGYEFIDATLAFADTTTMPFRWDSLWADRKTSKRQRLIFEEAKEFGISNGITIPVHGPRNGLAALSLSASVPLREFNEIWETRRGELTLIAAYTHEAMVQSALKNSNYEPIRLSDRQRECLLWTARGKTAWEIGQILPISEETVLFHLKSAMRKLDVFSKHHAVVKAIIHGLIMP